jgi:DNA-binding beta-propeller fold protein YncE
MRFEPVVGWGKLPEGWRYVECAGVAVDAQDNVFVFTRGEHPVIVFDREGRFLRSWGEGVVRRAHAITIDADGMVWLTDDLHHTVRKFTPEGKLLLTIGNPDTPSDLHGGKPFNRPTHVAICPRTGFLFISDGYGNSHVHKYAPDGRHVTSWGGPGTDPGQFNLPHNLCTDQDGLVYVADRESHRVQIFDGEGRYQGQWNQLHRPCGLYAEPRGSELFFVGELGAALPVNALTPNLGPRVSVLTRKGERICRFGGAFEGEKPGEFTAPHTVVTDSRGDLYVGEVSWTARGQLLDPPRELRSLQKFRRAAA